MPTIATNHASKVIMEQPTAQLTASRSSSYKPFQKIDHYVACYIFDYLVPQLINDPERSRTESEAQEKENLINSAALFKLSLTCRSFNELATPRLYQRPELGLKEPIPRGLLPRSVLLLRTLLSDRACTNYVSEQHPREHIRTIEWSESYTPYLSMPESGIGFQATCMSDFDHTADTAYFDWDVPDRFHELLDITGLAENIACVPRPRSTISPQSRYVWHNLVLKKLVPWCKRVLLTLLFSCPNVRTVALEPAPMFYSEAISNIAKQLSELDRSASTPGSIRKLQSFIIRDIPKSPANTRCDRCALYSDRTIGLLLRPSQHCIKSISVGTVTSHVKLQGRLPMLRGTCPALRQLTVTSAMSMIPRHNITDRARVPAADLERTFLCIGMNLEEMTILANTLSDDPSASWPLAVTNYRMVAAPYWFDTFLGLLSDFLQRYQRPKFRKLTVVTGLDIQKVGVRGSYVRDFKAAGIELSIVPEAQDGGWLGGN
ncbi:hypothetical protein QBC40DRAFT_258984 [Triangularia verruculosa]|uniref:Uncharacterized protein n=1 Tax=Triangularia verruculosa TaxID=2587418 RepID=A0AAN6X8H3_9PEZI|nr:hypothetical protein QBC40DRAFT_258984 [Triangularia verruculosa]